MCIFCKLVTIATSVKISAVTMATQMQCARMYRKEIYIVVVVVVFFFCLFVSIF